MNSEDAISIAKRLTELERDSKDTGKILLLVSTSLDLLSKNISALQEYKEYQIKVSEKLGKVEDWIDWLQENKKSIESIESEKKRLDAVREEVILNRPIQKALLAVTAAVVTSAIGLIVAYLFKN